jgi:hypothetical protein
MNNQDNTFKRQFVENYLKQQQYTSIETASTVSESEGHGGNLVVYKEAEAITLDEFKTYVKKWLELDNFVKKAKEAIKEKKKIQDKLSQIITQFMCKYDIEDLNTKDGKIRCKTQVVKAPQSQKIIKQKITDYFKDNENQKQDFIKKVYEERETVEKVSLRRLRIS